ncbi:MAG: hypothetical protein HY319_28330 [Armatimonadetes bacterium]|nr:hypothetical protein [Armatimonadota bacterium]
MRRSRGIALIVVLSVLAILLLIVLAVGSQGIGSLHTAQVHQHTRQSVYAAEAGVADGIRRVVQDGTFEQSFEAAFTDNSRYSVEVVNNFGGSGPRTASNGVVVPRGHTYLLSTGSRLDGKYPRKIGVMITGETGSLLDFAMAAGGGIKTHGPKTIQGSMKANGRIEFKAPTDIVPLDGSGRVLSADDIEVKSNFQMDSSQDIRARAKINGKVRGTEEVFPYDTSEATLAFINDGRTDNVRGPAEQGQVLPNPDLNDILAAPDLVDWSNTGVKALPVLDLSGKIHYFPDGLSVGRLTGEGTLVVGNGNSLDVDQDIAGRINIVLLRRLDQMPNDGNPSIDFKGDIDLEGLIYAHGRVETKGKFRLKGMIISYQDDIEIKGKSTMIYDPEALAGIPGFEPWVGSGGGAGSGPVRTVSWQRL